MICFTTSSSEEPHGSTSAAQPDATLALLTVRLRVGVRIDYEQAYIVEAQRRAGGRPLHFVIGDATRLPLRGGFDLATCLTNSWGTMSDKHAVLAEMRRCASSRLLSVFSERSIGARREWYQRFGHPIAEETSEWLLTAGGFAVGAFHRGPAARSRRRLHDQPVG